MNAMVIQWASVVIDLSPSTLVIKYASHTDTTIKR